MPSSLNVHSLRRLASTPRGKVVLGGVALVLLFWLGAIHNRGSPWMVGDLVHPPVPEDKLALQLGHPSFRDIREYERALPQHTTPRRIFSGGQRPRYVFFPNASWGSGWNNVFQEQLLNTHLAYLSNRAYVFPNYIPRDHPPFPDTLEDGNRHWLHIPMNAFVSGPTGGGPLSADASDPVVRRSISEQWWDVVCPPLERTVVNLQKTNEELGVDDSHEGGEILEKWAKKLRDLDAPCVSVEGNSVFTYMMIGTPRVLSTWSTYGSSPTLKQFAWSPVITAALFHNYHVISGTGNAHASPAPAHLQPLGGEPYTFTSFAPLRADSPPLAGVLALHVRRGDYEGHCPFLADIGADYNAWNNMGTPEGYPGGKPGRDWPQLPDYLDVPANTTRRDAAFAHCWPDMDAIVRRAAEVRKEIPALRTVYVATNGNKEWVADLSDALKKDGWDHVAGSMDMELSLEAQAVGQGVDMGVLTTAEAFIGVGFSSMSSNVVQIRLAGGRDTKSIHFW